MKKILSALIASLMLTSALMLPSCSEKQVDCVYVTVVNGELLLAHKAVELTDTDSDGILTVNDALYKAHEENFDGGAEAGYASETTDYGLSLTKLWGVDNGGSYGYLNNNVSCMSLADEIKADDHIVAYVYTDTASWSDTYSYFDKLEGEAGEITLTLMMNGYDENWNTVALPVDGAVITVDGTPTEYVTDANGVVTLSVNSGAVISAVSDTVNLVAPVCVIK